ncbi:MAG: dockerin type I repeat-containing protein [Ruminococcus sp.]|nr:dockerin type I repeat-containing protein [Ruminococcus sp.]
MYPTWVPKDFESALEFSNTYGNTRVEGQFVCFVLRRGVDTSAAKGYLACFPPYTCSYDSKVMSRCTDEFYYAVDEPWENDRVFEVIVFCTSSVGTFHLTFESAEEGIKQYTFDVDDDFNVTETDKYSWLPDCEKEFDEFRRQNGEVSVRGNNVIFCLEDNMGEGARWVHHSTEWARYVEHIRDVDCSARSELIKNGALDLLFRTDLNITGDVNKDGVFGIADAVCLQNWLLNGKTDEYFDWKAADLCIDNKLDIFDLVMLRKKLTKTGPAAQVSKGNEPVLVVETAASWKQKQDILVYDASGTAHHVYKSDGNAAYGDYDEPTVEENVPIIEFGSDGWYEELEDIISKPYSLYAKLKLDEEMLSQTNELSRRAEEINSEKWLETQPHWLDGSTMTIYLVNKVDSGETHLAKLCTLLASDSCLDNEEVQGYVLELLKNDAVDYPDLDMELETYLKYAKNKSEAPEKVTNVTA